MEMEIKYEIIWDMGGTAQWKERGIPYGVVILNTVYSVQHSGYMSYSLQSTA
jgi:hypothetical protein